MPKCRICYTPYYYRTEYEPEEPCVCGHGVYGESPWQYAGFKGVWAWFKYTKLRVLFDRIACPIANWLYKEFKF